MRQFIIFAMFQGNLIDKNEQLIYNFVHKSVVRLISTTADTANPSRRRHGEQRLGNESRRHSLKVKLVRFPVLKEQGVKEFKIQRRKNQMKKIISITESPPSSNGIYRSGMDAGKLIFTTIVAIGTNDVARNE
jgi:hypothetical protein